MVHFWSSFQFQGPDMILIFTDYGHRGPYRGQLQSALAHVAPEVRTVELMHDAPSRDPYRAAYLLAALAREMAGGSVCLAVVDPGVGGDRAPIIVSADGILFVGPDNGLFEILQRRAAGARAWRIDWRPERMSGSFHGRDLFAPVAAMLARGNWPDCAALKVDWREGPTRPGASWPDDLSEAIYIDGFGNVISGIRATELGKGAMLEVEGKLFSRARTFGDVAESQGFWYENSIGLAEIAVNGGSAATQYGIAIGDTVVLRR
jgi:S-adenosylmethionine hydrolase